MISRVTRSASPATVVTGPPVRTGGAKIRREYLAEITGLSKRTVDKVTPLLVSEGIVEEVEPHTGRRPAVLRLNPEPSQWGRFTPVEYAEHRTLDRM